MKRWLFYIGLICFISMLLASFLSFNVNMALSLITIMILPFSLWLLGNRFDKKVILVTLVTSSISFFSYILKSDFNFEKLLALDGKSIIVDGLITSYPLYVDQGVIYNVKINKTSVSNINKSFNSKLYLRDAVSLKPYSRFQGKVECFSPYLNAEGQLRRYYKSTDQAISIKSYSSDEFIWMDVVNKNIIQLIQQSILDVRQYLKSNLIRCYNNSQSSLMIGMLLGDKSGISYKTKKIFNIAGISHLLAVSGLHLTILIQTIYSFLNMIKLGRKKSILLSVMFTLFFIAVTGFSASAVRAGIMNVIYLIGLIIEKESDALNSLGLSLIFILMFNPFLAMNVGLQLSFLATLSIIVFKPKVYYKLCKLFVISDNKKINKLMKFICDMSSVSISAMIFTSPITVTMFNQVSLIAPITNVILAPIIQPTLILIMITSILSGIIYIEFLYKFFAIMASIGVYIIKGVAEIMASIPFASITISKGYLYIWFISVILLIIVNQFWLKNMRMKKHILLFSLIILLIGKLSNDIVIYGNICRRSIGEIDRNYIISDSKSAIMILIDNDKYLLRNIDDVLKSSGVKCVDQAVIGENFNINDIINIISEYKPDKLVASEYTISLIINKFTNNNTDFKIVKNKNGVFILKNSFLGLRKTQLKLLKQNSVAVVSCNGRLTVKQLEE